MEHAEARVQLESLRRQAASAEAALTRGRSREGELRTLLETAQQERDEARAAALPHRATAEVDLYRSQVRHMVEKSVQIQPHFTTANASHS